MNAPQTETPVAPEETGTPQRRKLSKLQKQILALALGNKLREERAFDMGSGADVFYSEILATVYGFPLERPLREVAGDFAGMRTGGHRFDPKRIGKARYNAAQAAVSRAVLRLESRGLVLWARSVCSHWSGCDLTPAGFEYAQTVNTADTVSPDLTVSLSSNTNG